MSDTPPPAVRPAGGSAGCGTTIIAVIALLMAMSAGNQARNNHSSHKLRTTQNEVRTLESKVADLRRRIEMLEKR